MTVTHFAISDADKAEIRERVKKISLLAGHEIKDNQISFPGLLKRPEGCISGGYSNEALLITGEHEKTYDEYPIDIQTKKIKDNFHEKILKHILQETWMSLKIACRKVDESHYAHYDATINTIWNERIQRKHPKLANGMSFTPKKTTISSKIKGEHTVWIDNDCIKIDMEMPESIKHGKIDRITDLIHFPHCGDDKVQEIFEDQMVLCVSSEGGQIVIKTSFLTYPMESHSDIYPWRELQKMERNFMATMVEYDPIRYDEEGDAARVRSEIRSFLKRNGTPEEWYAKTRKLEPCQ